MEGKVVGAPPAPPWLRHCLLLQRDQDTAICLLHPFTGDIAEFPPLETLLPYVDVWTHGCRETTRVISEITTPASVWVQMESSK